MNAVATGTGGLRGHRKTLEATYIVHLAGTFHHNSEVIGITGSTVYIILILVLCCLRYHTGRYYSSSRWSIIVLFSVTYILARVLVVETLLQYV